MANNLGEFTPELWSARIQVLLKNNLVGAAIANTEERPTLTKGDKVHRPYHSELYDQAYTKGVTPTFLDVTTNDEYLEITEARILPLYVDDIDKIQNKYQTLSILNERAAYQLRDRVDAKVLSEIANSALGNTTALTLGMNNIVSAVSQAKADLANNGVEENKPWIFVMDPDQVAIVEQYFAANGFKRLDETLDNGYGNAAYLGQWLGLQCYKSQNLPSTAVLAMATQPNDGDTVVINGITFTFKTVLGASAGNVLIGGSADAARANLAALINAPQTTTANGVALTATNVAKLKRRYIVATNDNTADTLTLTAAGKMTLSQNLTASASDKWGTQTMASLIAQTGSIDLVMQEDVMSKFQEVTDGRVGTNIITWDLYGVKTFVEGAQRMYKLTRNVS